MPEPSIRVRGVRVHNLRSVDLDLPRGQLIAFCGVSGSGKTSLALDTLYAEGNHLSPSTHYTLKANAAISRAFRPILANSSSDSTSRTQNLSMASRQLLRSRTKITRDRPAQRSERQQRLIIISGYSSPALVVSSVTAAIRRCGKIRQAPRR